VATLNDLKTNMPEISFVIPVFNELESLSLMFEYIHKIDNHLIQNKLIGRCEYILIDDGSRDGSEEFIISQIKVKDRPVIKLGSHKMNSGYGAAIQSGIHLAEYDWVLTFDADGQHSCESIISIINQLIKKSHALLIIGSRVSNPQLNLRSVGRRLLNWSEVSFLGSKLNDANNGLKCFNKNVFFELEKIIPAPFDMSFSQHLAQTFHALSPVAVEEVSIKIQERKSGNSKIHAKDFFIALRQNLTLAYSLKPRRFYFILASLIFLVAVPYSITIISINKAGMPVAGGLAIAIGFSFVVLGELRQVEREQNLSRLKGLLRIKYFFNVFKKH